MCKNIYLLNFFIFSVFCLKVSNPPKVYIFVFCILTHLFLIFENRHISSQGKYTEQKQKEKGNVGKNEIVQRSTMYSTKRVYVCWLREVMVMAQWKKCWEKEEEALGRQKLIFWCHTVKTCGQEWSYSKVEKANMEQKCKTEWNQ